MKIRFIHNPRAGRNRDNPRLLPAITRFIAERRLDADIVPTARPGHAAELASQAVADGCALVVAVGGDGTLNEVGRALVHSPAALGLVPCGSGNGLARHLGIPRALPAALTTLVTGRVRAIDAGLANGRLFFNTMGLGFEALVAARFNRLGRRGLPAYARVVAGAGLRHRPATCVIQHENGELTSPAFLVSVANSDRYGGRARIAPGARADDGFLDLVILRRAGPLSMLPLALRLLTGRFDRSRAVTRLRGRRFGIEQPAAGPMHTDGEVHETAARVEVQILPAAVKIMLPAAP